MEKQEALKLLQEATARIERESGNANGGAWQAGGVYWRLSKVLYEYVDPALDSVEGELHAKFLRETHYAGPRVMP